MLRANCVCPPVERGRAERYAMVPELARSLASAAATNSFARVQLAAVIMPLRI